MDETDVIFILWGFAVLLYSLFTIIHYNNSLFQFHRWHFYFTNIDS